MLSATNRFHRRSAITKLYQQGRSARAGVVSLKYEPSRGQHTRCAVSVSKKIDKRAVVRNRIRRRIYARLSELLPEINRTYDMVVTVHDKKIAEMPPTELNRLLRQLLEKAQVFKG